LNLELGKKNLGLGIQIIKSLHREHREDTEAQRMHKATEEFSNEVESGIRKEKLGIYIIKALHREPQRRHRELQRRHREPQRNSVMSFHP